MYNYHDILQNIHKKLAKRQNQVKYSVNHLKCIPKNLWGRNITSHTVNIIYQNT